MTKQRQYRGWTKDGKRIEGDVIVNPAFDLKDGIHEPDLRSVFIRERIKKWNNKEKCWMHHSYRVLEESVGQATGELDKNKKPIFGGDIFEVTQTPPCWLSGEVRFSNGSFRVHALLLCEVAEKGEVIGTIHDGGSNG